MAFVDNRGSRNRTAVTIATIGIEALAILAVVKGLDVPFLNNDLRSETFHWTPRRPRPRRRSQTSRASRMTGMSISLSSRQGMY
jgi:hypothetical protein